MEPLSGSFFDVRVLSGLVFASRGGFEGSAPTLTNQARVAVHLVN